MITRLKGFLIQQVVPGWYSFRAERIIQNDTAKTVDQTNSYSATKEYLDKFNNALEKYKEDQIERRKTIDDKAKSSLLIITVSTTVMISGLNLVKEGKISFRIPLVILIILAVAYLLQAAITAVKALDASQFYITHPDDWIKETDDESITLEEPKATAVVHRNVLLNDRVLNIRTNFVSATLISMRNGTILLSIAFVIALLNLGQVERAPAAPALPIATVSPTGRSQTIVSPTQTPSAKTVNGDQKQEGNAASSGASKHQNQQH